MPSNLRGLLPRELRDAKEESTTRLRLPPSLNTFRKNASQSYSSLSSSLSSSSSSSYSLMRKSSLNMAIAMTCSMMKVDVFIVEYH